MKKLTDKVIDLIEPEVILLLLNCMQTEALKGNPFSFNCNNPHYSEAFGMLRTMCNLGYCFYGAVNIPQIKENANYWFSELQKKAKEEANKLGMLNAQELYGVRVNVIKRFQFDC